MLGSFETDRLSLRPIVLGDVDLLLELDSDPEVMRYLTGRPSSRSEVAATIGELIGWRWVGFERVGGGFVGWYGLVPGLDGTFDIGYRLMRRWWNNGFATEGTQALIDVAFAELQAARVIAQTMVVNERSRRVMERCGMRQVRTFHLEWDDPLPGTDKGEVEYELTKDLWRQTRG